MALEIKVGMDPEFMAKCNDMFIYPGLGREQAGLVGQSDRVRDKIRNVTADEFGHCVEIRPVHAANGKQLVLNVIDAMSSLPKCFTYHAVNTHRMDKKTCIALIRRLGRKDISPSLNIYGKDVLDDCPADIKARQLGQRLLFCGTHMHLSARREIQIRVNDDVHTDYENVQLPVQTLVKIFDTLIFGCFDDDDEFNVGRYRSRGFYEEKPHGGFEYRSLGSTAMTPIRIKLIADLMIDITQHVLDNIDDIMFNGLTLKHEFPMYGGTPLQQEIHANLCRLECTKPLGKDVDLRMEWVPFAEEYVIPEPVKELKRYTNEEILIAMHRHNGDVGNAARALGCSRSTIVRRMKKLTEDYK